MSTCAEAWLYSEGSTTRGIDAWIQCAGVKYYLAAPTRFRAAMAAWGGLQGAGYTLAYSATTRRVTISAAGAFALVLPRGVANLLGFTSLSYGAAASHTGETYPAGICEVVAADVYPLADGARIDLKTLRHGRSLAIGWGNTQIFEATLHLRSVDLDIVLPELTTTGAGYLLSGKLRIERGDATAYSSTNPDGYLDGWVVGIKDVQARGDDDGYSSVTLVLAVDTTEVEPTISSARCFDSVRFGWGVVWALFVEGVPSVFVERATGLSLPSGWTAEDPSLIIDDSGDIGSQVDRARGVGCGLSLTWALLDSAIVSPLMQAPAHTAKLTQTETPTAATLHVDDTTGWPASGSLHIGLERVTYTGKTATTFTGCTRGTASSPSLAYEHRVGKAGSLVTDTLRWWRGRDVRLYAIPVDPGGVVASADGALLTDAEMVWRGRIDGGPQRKAHRWEWSAGSLDRVLDRPLVAKQSGTVVDHVKRYKAQPDKKISVTAWFVHSDGSTATYLIQWQPYASLSGYVTGAALRAAWVSTWSAACTSAGCNTIFGALSWWEQSPGLWRARSVLTAQGGAGSWGYLIHAFGSLADNGTWPDVTVASTCLVSNQLADDCAPPQPTAGDNFGLLTSTASIALQIDDGDPADVPSSGILVRQEGWGIHYSNTAIDEGIVIFVGLWPNPDPEIKDGESLEIRHVTAGTAAEIAPKILESSGTAALRGSADSLARGEGYGIDSTLINVDSFADQPAALADLDLSVGVAGQSMADAIGGVFAIGQTALVSRRMRDGVDVRLHCVDTHASGSDIVTTIYDRDLLALEDEPVTLEDRADPPNEMKITVSPAGSKKTEQTITIRDLPAADVLGVISEEYAVPATDAKALVQLAPNLGAAKFAGDLVAQALTIRVGPWIDVHVGDAVKLVLTHPAIWDASAGTIGYTGRARCVARTVNPRTLIAKLTLLINGAVAGCALAPSALVTAIVAGGVTPTSVKVPRIYYAHFHAALVQAAAQIKCLTYRRGSDEAISNWCHVTGATDDGTDCVLTLADWTGEGCVVASETSLTLPLLSDAAETDFQDGFAHDQDGTRWL